MSVESSEYVSIGDHDSLKCMICLGFAVHPYQHEECGKLLCTDCKNKLKQRDPCPNCRQARPKYFRDRKSQREILAVRIKCGNGNNGCNWRGIIEKWEDHASRCGYASVSCPNKCNTKAILRNTLNGHLNECPMREFICVWCTKIGTFTHITSEHEQVCLLKRVGCPQPGCREVMERKLIDGHIASNCKYSVVPCKYDSIGCCVKKRRIEISDHEAKDGEHLSLALATVQQLQQDVSALKNNTFTFKLIKYYALKQRSHGWFEDHTFQCGYNVYISVYPNGYHEATNHYLSVYIDVEEPPRSSLLQWPFKGTVTVEILNQMSNHSHYKRTVESFVPRSNHPEIAAEFDHLICHSSVEAPSRKGCQYLLGDTLYFRVTVLSASTKPWLECSSTLDTTNTETNSVLSD